MRLGSVATGLRKRHIARFPAIRAVVQTIGAEVYVVHALADGTVFFASALVFRFVALRTDNWTVRHWLSPRKTLPEWQARRQDTLPSFCRPVFLICTS